MSETISPESIGLFGGRYVPEMLMAAPDRLDMLYERAETDQTLPG